MIGYNCTPNDQGSLVTCGLRIWTVLYLGSLVPYWSARRRHGL